MSRSGQLSPIAPLMRQGLVDINTTSSLQSSPPPAAEAEDGPQAFIFPTVEVPGSPAFSTSSTADEGGSSPILPPLPAPTFRGRTFERTRTPPSSSGENSSHYDASNYYTASWGSPYEQQQGASQRARSLAHTHTLSSSELSEDSPIRHLEFHTPFLRPAPTFERSHTDPEFVSQDGLISAAVLANRARRPATGLTEDWIRQHTGGEAAERNHWLSDEGDSEHSSLSGSISGDARVPEDEARTPTLRRVDQSGRAFRPSLRGHHRFPTAETLRQEDFLDIPVDSAIPRMSLTDENQMDVSVMDIPSPMEDRPPPPPPKEWRTSNLSGVSQLISPSQVGTPAPGPPRLKKKVPWKGKNILVLLPWDDERGQHGKRPMPMSPKDVIAMMKEWEQLGYDTTGFNLGHDDVNGEEGGHGQSRSAWPLTRDIVHDRSQRSYKVKIPNRKEWDDYVEEMREAKLRALGVSLGTEDPIVPLVSPAVSNLSRRTSMQYPPLPFSPPLPTSSANSMGLPQHQNLFSPGLVPGAGMSTSQSSNPGSISSPASLHAHIQGKYNSRQSVSFNSGGHPFGSPFQYPQQSSPGVWSPQQVLYQDGGARGGSPSLQNLGALVSPASPFSQDGYFPQQTDVVSQMQQRQQILQNQLAHQQQLQMQGGARASPRLEELREVENEDAPPKSPSKTPEARQIKHNPSASLQKEIDDAEYHLEEQFQRQLEHEDYSPHSDKGETSFDQQVGKAHIRNASTLQHGLVESRFVDHSDSGPVLHHPQPHSRGHSLSQRPFQDSEDSSLEKGMLRAARKGDISDIETNPSNVGTPVQTHGFPSSGHERSLSENSNPWANDAEPKSSGSSSAPRPLGAHSRNASTLNVAAKPFEFKPGNAFGADSFNFTKNAFQAPPTNAYSAFNPPSATSSHFSNHSIGSKTRVNANAPTFSPGSQEFNFSAAGPSFRPDAPTFTPSSNVFSIGSDSMGSGSEGPRTSIFGNIDLNALGISKPTKKNKAIPIVRPDSSGSRDLEEEELFDKDGRPTQSDSRFKRARGKKEDGDSVPLFAEPSMPLGETAREQSPPKEDQTSLATVTDKENSAPLSADDCVPEIPSSNFMSSPNLSGKEFAPFEFTQQKQAEEFNAAVPFTSRRYGSGLPAYGVYSPSESEARNSPVVNELQQKGKSHKKSMSSLSATAKPFEFRAGSFNLTYQAEGSAAGATDNSASEAEAEEEEDRAPTPPLNPSATLKAVGLSGSRFARSPTPPTAEFLESPISPETNFKPQEASQFQGSLPQPQSPPVYDRSEVSEEQEPREPTFEEIDAVMRHMNEAEALSAPGPVLAQPSPRRRIQVPNAEDSSPIRLLPQNVMRSDAPSPSPRRGFQPLPGQANVFARVSEDPFAVVDQQRYASPVHHNRMESIDPSEWDDVLSETEEAKLQPRAQFFDNHVNDLVGGLLAERLDPLGKTLETIQMSLDMMAARAPGSRRDRDRRSISGALSDADDEDDDNARRPLSPQRRDYKLDKIRAIVFEALAAHQSSRPTTASQSSSVMPLPDSRNVLQALEEMKEQFGQSMRLDLRGEDLRNIVEETIEKRMPLSPSPTINDAIIQREAEYKARIAELEERLFRADGDNATRMAELEERLGRTETATEHETKNRRAAEDRLAEVQRLLRISSEEEDRLREAMEEREIKIREIVEESDAKVRNAEQERGKTAMRIALLEAANDNFQTTQVEKQNQINIMEQEIRESRQEAHNWRVEAERALEVAKRHSEDADMANDTNKELRHTIEALRTQMEESIRVREGMRGKLMDLQEAMARAARDITEDNARRAKKEAELVARQEVLDAKLQAEARTRERLELEIERLENGEREGMRAVNDLKKLEITLAEMREQHHEALKESMRSKREFEEARESGLSEVQRTKQYMQIEIDMANNQVNMIREDLENQVMRLRLENDQIKMDADMATAKLSMLHEESETAKEAMLNDLHQKHADAIEDIHTQHERQLNNTIEDGQRAEQHLLERLSLSSAKTEHLQDRVAHLEEKLEIAHQAAKAAVTSAKSARSASIPSAPVHATAQKSASRGMELPEKISPQALRESIMVLQEQLQAREATIEELEATLSTMDLDAPTKISKRDDEIMWLRELLAVRKGDLTDIVSSLESEHTDIGKLRDAAIRLRANLQMEEQERERAMNGGSALNLPNIAASIAASPRVAQAVGPLAAAWGNWRKGRGESVALPDSSRDRSSSSTPSRGSPGNQSFLSGLLTPPASSASARVSSTPSAPQPSAFGSTGQRFTSAQLANRPRTIPRHTSQNSNMRKSPRKEMRADKGKGLMTLDRPSTPQMMRKSSYDSDAALAEDFSDAGFYDDDESTVEGGHDVYGSSQSLLSNQ